MKFICTLSRLANGNLLQLSLVMWTGSQWSHPKVVDIRCFLADPRPSCTLLLRRSVIWHSFAWAAAPSSARSGR
jgi:hypothetical protein